MAETEAPPDLRLLKVAQAPLDPLDRLWDRAPALRIDLMAQRMATPHGTGEASSLEVRGLHDEEHVSFRLGWSAPTTEQRVGIDQYRDACALMFASRPGDLPPVTMGGPGNPVIIWQWKPDWEDPAAQESWRKTRYPEYADFYNPSNEALFANVGDRPHANAVNVLVAEGFGSLTRTEDPDLDVASRHTGKDWRVVFRHRLPAEYPLLGLGLGSSLTAAAWDGAHHERGSRKNLSYQWNTYRLEGTGPASTPAWTSPSLLAAGATAAGIAWIIRRRMQMTKTKDEDPLRSNR